MSQEDVLYYMFKASIPDKAQSKCPVALDYKFFLSVYLD